MGVSLGGYSKAEVPQTKMPSQFFSSTKAQQHATVGQSAGSAVAVGGKKFLGI